MRPAQATGTFAKDVLFARRPDFGEIQLTCENTNTVLPYVDLVNEVLEEAVSPGTGTPASGRQTTATPQELAANPEHSNAGAYARLRQEVFPWGLPFDLWTEETRTYLNHLGVTRHELMKALQRPGMSRASEVAVATESLGLTRAERLIVTGRHGDLTPPRAPWEFWGFPAASPGDWVAQTAELRALLEKSGLTADELQELLKARFVNPDGALEIEAKPTGTRIPATPANSRSPTCRIRRWTVFTPSFAYGAGWAGPWPSWTRRSAPSRLASRT